MAWELLIESDYARVASVIDELAKSSSVERRGAALLVAAQALESGVAPSIVLTDAVAPSLLSAADRKDAALGPVAGRALKRVVSAASDKPLEVATLLLARGGAHASTGAGGKAVVALVEACDDADFATHVEERSEKAAAGDASAVPWRRAFPTWTLGFDNGQAVPGRDAYQQRDALAASSVFRARLARARRVGGAF